MIKKYLITRPERPITGILLRFIAINFILYPLVFTQGQSNGDYRTVKSGIWEDKSVWETYLNSTVGWRSAGNAPTNFNSVVTVVQGHTLTVNGDLTGNSQTGDLIVSGILNMGNFLIKSSQSQGIHSIVINGTLNTNASVTAVSFTLASGGYFKTAYSGAAGWWNSTFAPSSVSVPGTIEFSGIGVQLVPVIINGYGNVIISGAGIKNLSGNQAINGTLSVNQGATLYIASLELKLNGAGLILNGIMQPGPASSLTFNGGSQVISGSGEFTGTINRITIGNTAASNTLLTAPGLLSVNTLTISGAPLYTASSFSVGPVSKVTVNTSLDIFVNDGLILKSSTSPPYTSASLIVAPGAMGLNGGNGTVRTELYLTGGGSPGTYKWHYISTPFTALPVTVFTAQTPNVAYYAEPVVSTDLQQGWIGHDGWIYSSLQPAFNNSYAFSSLIPGIGYDYFDTEDHQFTFSGMLNQSDVQAGLSYNGTSKSGFNLLGNPFPSGLNWDYITGNSFPSGTSKSIWFTRDNVPCSYVNGVGSPADVTGIIPPMQGFFVRTSGPGRTINLGTTARTHNTIHQRYKGSVIIPLIRLELAGPESSDETVLRFDDRAKSSFDYDFDAGRVFEPSGTGIGTISEGREYVINGQPFPDTVGVYQAGISIPSAGSYCIKSTSIQGLWAFRVLLSDNFDHTVTDLKSVPSYSFTSEKGKFDNRFVLTVIRKATGTDDIQDDKSFKIFYSKGFLKILLAGGSSPVMGDVSIFDLTGKKVFLQRNAEFNMGEIKHFQVSLTNGIFITEVRTGYGRYTGRIVGDLSEVH